MVVLFTVLAVLVFALGSQLWMIWRLSALVNKEEPPPFRDRARSPVDDEGIVEPKACSVWVGESGRWYRCSRLENTFVAPLPSWSVARVWAVGGAVEEARASSLLSVAAKPQQKQVVNRKPQWDTACVEAKDLGWAHQLPSYEELVGVLEGLAAEDVARTLAEGLTSHVLTGLNAQQMHTRQIALRHLIGVLQAIAADYCSGIQISCRSPSIVSEVTEGWLIHNEAVKLTDGRIINGAIQSRLTVRPQVLLGDRVLLEGLVA